MGWQLQGTIASSGGGTVAVPVKTFFTFSVPGALTVAAGNLRIPIMVPISNVRCRVMVNTAPTGASAIFDVNRNSGTLFTTQANRPTIAAGAFDSGIKTPYITSLVAGDYLKIDVDQIGSTVAGADAVLIIEGTI